MAIAFEPHSLVSFSEDEDGRRIHKVRYKATTTTPGTTGDMAIRAAFNTAYPYGTTTYSYQGDVDEWAVRTRPITITPSRKAGTGTHSRWYIDATFDTLGDKHCSEETLEAEPWNLPWTRSKNTSRLMEIVTEDKDGTELTNTADEPYYPAPERERIDPTLIFTGNLQSIDFFLWSEFEDKGGAVNENQIGPWPPRTLKVVSLDWQEAFWGGCSNYFQCNVQIAVKADTWDRTFKQMGFREKTSSNPNVYSDFGTTLPKPLDANGAEATTPAEVTYRLQPEKDFSQIGFPMTLLTT